MNRKQILSRRLFDFANSSCSAVIAAVVFPIFCIADLEAPQPVSVVHHKKTWQVDGITVDIQVPELTRHLKERYRAFLDLRSTMVLKRVRA